MRRTIAGSRNLITGASQGIGKALTEEAVRRGAQVLAVARSGELLEQLREPLRNHKGSLHVLTGDVTSPEDRQRMADAIREHFGALDVLVNNAGGQLLRHHGNNAGAVAVAPRG
jgi:NAD(P)-dependent dehydrogenase (short-subunit alcohol dehydrogenase family)